MSIEKLHLLEHRWNTIGKIVPYMEREKDYEVMK